MCADIVNPHDVPELNKAKGRNTSRCLRTHKAGVGERLCCLGMEGSHSSIPFQVTGIIHAYDEVPRNFVLLEQLHKVVIYLQQRIVGLERCKLNVKAMLWSHNWQLAEASAHHGSGLGGSAFDGRRIEAACTKPPECSAGPCVERWIGLHMRRAFCASECLGDPQYALQLHGPPCIARVQYVRPKGEL